jgi:hypothetical protein
MACLYGTVSPGITTEWYTMCDDPIHHQELSIRSFLSMRAEGFADSTNKSAEDFTIEQIDWFQRPSVHTFSGGTRL